MSAPILATKLHIPAIRPNALPHSRLIDQLGAGLHLSHKLSLKSAPAGFGTTTLAAAWISAAGRPTSWLTLDEEHSDPPRPRAGPA